MKPIDEYFITGSSDLLPRAKNIPIGKHRINAKAETIKVSERPHQAPVSIHFNPNIPPEINLIPIIG